MKEYYIDENGEKVSYEMYEEVGNVEILETKHKNVPSKPKPTRLKVPWIIFWQSKFAVATIVFLSLVIIGLGVVLTLKTTTKLLETSVGEWSDWETDGTCSNSCGGGSQMIKRNCSSSTVNCKGPNMLTIRCNLQTCEYTKILVAIGEKENNITLNSIEIIDLSSSESTCQNFPNFTVGNDGSAGMLLNSNVPLICGGTNDASSCYTFVRGSWQKSSTLNWGRSYFAMTKSPFLDDGSSVFVSGGKFPSKTETNTTEVLSESGWKESVPLPVINLYHCMVLVDQEKVMVIGGSQDGIISSKTFIFNVQTKGWTEGPLLKNKRDAHNCAIISRAKFGKEDSIIVVGGYDDGKYLSSVEVLDIGSSIWQTGPSFPTPICCGGIVQDGDGAVIMVGGKSGPSTPSNSLYKLSHAGSDAQWVKLPQVLEEARSYLVAFKIPDELANCTLKK